MTERKERQAAEADDARENGIDVEVTEAGEEAWRDKYLRTLAELDNYRKRMERERELGRAYALEGLMRDLLPVLDDLELAATAAAGDEAIREGIDVARRRALNVLEGKGMRAIEALGEAFDPRFHEAVGAIPGTGQPAGTIVNELRRGYVLNDRVLRPSRVQIAMEPPVIERDEDSEE